MDSSLSALHVLQWPLLRLCWQMPDPPHSLHVLLRRLCWQMLDPPHSLHVLLLRLCSHCPAVPPRARFPPPLPPPSSPSGAALLVLPTPLFSSSPLLSPEPPDCPNWPPLRPSPLLSPPLRALAPLACAPMSAHPLPLPPLLYTYPPNQLPQLSPRPRPKLPGRPLRHQAP